MIPVLLCVSVLTFLLSHVGGDPVSAYVTEETPPQVVAQVIERYHLNEPLYAQYWWYLRGLFRGEWGISRSAGNLPVWQAIKSYFPASLELGALSMLIAVVVSLPLGVLSAIRQNSFLDNVTRIFALSGVSIPIFWLALLLQYFLYFNLKMAGLPHLPLGGRVALPVVLCHPLSNLSGLYLFDSLVTMNWHVFASVLQHLVLPAGTLAFASLGILTRITRSSMLEILEEDYIKVARSKGLSESSVMMRALRNALIPVVTVAGLRMGAILSGAILVETVFFFPGIGLWAVKAIAASDSAAIMAFVLLVAFMRSVLNLFADIMYLLLDPRIRY